MVVTSVQIRKKGSMTLPNDLRSKYGVSEGDIYTLIDLGDGAFLLTPRLSQINKLGDRVASLLEEESVSLDDLLAALDEERERYYREHYAPG